MNIVKQIEEQMKNNVDNTYNEELSIIKKRLDEAWEIYDHEHLINNIPPGSELYHMGKLMDLAIEYFQSDLGELEDQLIDWPEDPFELDEEMRQQEEYYAG
jgi:hypothetical protein